MPSRHSQTDPRLYQIGSLSGLLLFGIYFEKFDIRIAQVFAILVTVFLTELLFRISKGQSAHWTKISTFHFLSPLISGLSICLLLRTNVLWVSIATAFVAITSKFLLRWNGKHFFNPTAFAIFTILLVSDQAWISPGQWGDSVLFIFLILGLGNFVVLSAHRNDVSLSFFLFFTLLVFAWALWLGDPFTVPFHQIQNGSFLLFVFFMLSDPKTTPNSRGGRIFFAASVAIVAYYLRFHRYESNFLIPALVYCSFLVPLLNGIFPGSRYEWKRAKLREVLL